MMMILRTPIMMAHYNNNIALMTATITTTIDHHYNHQKKQWWRYFQWWWLWLQATKCHYVINAYYSRQWTNVNPYIKKNDQETNDNNNKKKKWKLKLVNGALYRCCLMVDWPKNQNNMRSGWLVGRSSSVLVVVVVVTFFISDQKTRQTHRLPNFYQQASKQQQHRCRKIKTRFKCVHGAAI